MRLIEHWRTVLYRSAVTWVTSILTFLVGALGSSYMAIFAFLGLGFLPLMIQAVVGGFTLLVVVGGPIILARIVEQPKMNAKIEEKNIAANEPSPDPKAAERSYAAVEDYNPGS